MYGNPTRKRKFSEQVVPRIADPRELSLLARRQSTDSAYSGQATNPFDDADYPIPDFQRVYNLMRDPTHGLQLADRRWGLRTYSKCFIGSHAVQWMVDNLSLEREAAVSMGQRLMEAGIVHHVTHSELFCDHYYYYRFQEDDDTNILNMKRIWDSSIPTRHAVDVSKDLLTRLAFLCEEHRKRVLEAKPSSKASPAGPSSSAVSLPNILPSTPSLPANPATTAAERSAAMSPSLARSFSASPRIPQQTTLQSPVLMSTPPLLRMSSSPTLSAAPKHTVGDDVDYSTLAKSEDFRQYTLAAAELQHVQLVALNHEERIAFFVNCYNALCLHGYVTHGPPNSFLRRYVFFRALSYRIAGLDMTMDDIEHGILRGNKRPPMIKFLQQLRPSDPKCQHVLAKRDGRIHFVISAGTRSDPPIRILDGENVQEQLHDATVEFLSYSVKLDIERRTVTLPRIFLWYAEDFPSPEKDLLQWVARYLPVEVSQHLRLLVSGSETAPTVSYQNFDWANAEARFNASVVRRKRMKLERERSCGLEQFPEQDGLDLSLGQSDGISSLFATNLFPSTEAQFGNGNPIIPQIPNSNEYGSHAAKLEELFPPRQDEVQPVRDAAQGARSESGHVSTASRTNRPDPTEAQRTKDVQPTESASNKA